MWPLGGGGEISTAISTLFHKTSFAVQRHSSCYLFVREQSYIYRLRKFCSIYFIFLCVERTVHRDRTETIQMVAFPEIQNIKTLCVHLVPGHSCLLVSQLNKFDRIQKVVGFFFKLFV